MSCSAGTVGSPTATACNDPNFPFLAAYVVDPPHPRPALPSPSSQRWRHCPGSELLDDPTGVAVFPL
jgi:hypothetical protein